VHCLGIPCDVLGSNLACLCVVLGGCEVNLEVIVVAVRIDPMSCKYESNLVVDSSSNLFF
jgi:hypothetical protein